MIGIKLRGRLGNQLFQYAFVRSLAIELNTNFYLDKSNEEYLLSKYFTVKSDKSLIFEKLLSLDLLNRRCNFFIRKKIYLLLRKYYRLNQKTYDDDRLHIKFTNQVLFSGFFQSAKYFSNHAKEINLDFQIKSKFKKEFEKIIVPLSNSKKITSVHIRRTDYIDTNFFLPVEYFHDAIKKYSPKDNLIIFISDDPEFVEKEFSYLNNKYISRNSEIIDFQFLMIADICIISNSTFGWWGSYLNPNSEKKIICPEFWSGFKNKIEEPYNIILEEWIKVPVI